MSYVRILVSFLAVALMTSGVHSARPVKARDIVLVHGALLDGSGWRAVHDELKVAGHRVSVVQLPLSGLADDVAATKRVIDQQNGPVVLVGHSYGGAVISVAGTHPKVKALVYVAAFQPDVGESAGDLGARRPLTSHVGPAGNGLIKVDPAFYRADIAADLPRDQAAFMAASQVFTSPKAFSAKLPAAAWRAKPSFGIVASDDKTIDPETQRFMYRRSGARITEIKASHAVYISQPRAVARVIAEAAQTIK